MQKTREQVIRDITTIGLTEAELLNLGILWGRPDAGCLMENRIMNGDIPEWLIENRLKKDT